MFWVRHQGCKYRLNPPKLLLSISAITKRIIVSIFKCLTTVLLILKKQWWNHMTLWLPYKIKCKYYLSEAIPHPRWNNVIPSNKKPKVNNLMCIIPKVQLSSSKLLHCIGDVAQCMFPSTPASQLADQSRKTHTELEQDQLSFHLVQVSSSAPTIQDKQFQWVWIAQQVNQFFHLLMLQTRLSNSKIKWSAKNPYTKLLIVIGQNMARIHPSSAKSIDAQQR